MAYLEGGDWAWAVAVLFRHPEMELLEERTLRFRARFPYVPGFLFFREGPGLLGALSLLRHSPDLILLDGQGVAHPRGLGLASHLGVLLGKPTIGCAKSRLVGEFDGSLLGPEKGSWVPLMLDGHPAGAVVRTRTGVKPLFVSPGHLVTVRRCVELVLASARRFRLPEPLRQAHLRAQRCCQGSGKEDAAFC